MKNEEKRDQLIRETFDQCLDGIDNLPSNRTDILRKTEDQTKTRRQPRFRVTAAAAALVVLLCIGVMAVSGRWGTVNHPDTIRPGNRFAILPIETVLSEGGEQNGAVTISKDEADGVSLEAGPAVYDGRTLAFDLTFENSQAEAPVYCRLEEFSANGTEIDRNGIQFDTSWIPSRWTRSVWQNRVSAILPREMWDTDQIHVRIKLKTYRPVPPVYEMEETTEGFDPETARRKIEEGYYLTADGWGMMHYDPAEEEWYDMIDEPDGEMGEVKEEKLILSLDLTGPGYGVLETRSGYENEYCTASYDVAAVEGSGLHLTLRLHPKDECADLIQGFVLTDGEGTPLQGGIYEPDVSVKVDQAGQDAVVYRYRWSEIGRKDLPDTISLSCMLENGGLMIFPLKVR